MAAIRKMNWRKAVVGPSSCTVGRSPQPVVGRRPAEHRMTGTIDSLQRRRQLPHCIDERIGRAG